MQATTRILASAIAESALLSAPLNPIGSENSASGRNSLKPTVIDGNNHIYKAAFSLWAEKQARAIEIAAFRKEAEEPDRAPIPSETVRSRPENPAAKRRRKKKIAFKPNRASP